MKGQRTLAYIVLIIISFFCLFWFYVLFINATRSNGALKRDSQPFPEDISLRTGKSSRRNTPCMEWYVQQYFHCYLLRCFMYLFSTMTAYAIHAYNFKAKKFMFTFILAVMMIPTQVTALGFLQLLGK